MGRGQASLQIGKNGFQKGTVEAIKNYFKTREDVKINFLKSSEHTKEIVKETAEKIQKQLGEKYTYKIVGFTIFLKKWRKARK